MKLKYVFWFFPWMVFLVGDNKMLLGVFVLLSVLLWVKKIAPEKIVFLLLLMSLPFERGLRGWMVPVVIGSEWVGGEGYGFYFGFSLKLFLLFLLVIWQWRGLYSEFLTNKVIKWLVLFLLWVVISCLVNGVTFVTALGLVKIVYLFFLFLVARVNWKDVEAGKWFDGLVSGWLLFFGFLGVFQFVRQNFIGLYLEEGGDISRFGYLTNESQFLYRVSGLMGHPTFFASWLSILLLAGLGLFLSYVDKKKKDFSKSFLVFGLMLSLISLMATYSRSGWLIVGFGGLFLLVKYLKRGRLVELLMRMKWFFIVGLFAAWFYGGYLTKRLESFRDIFTFGSGRGRIELMLEAVNMIKNNPVFGVGLNRFTEIMVKQNVSGAGEYFLYPVHNTWILLASEVGLPAMVLLAIFVFMILKKRPKRMRLLGVWVGLLSFIFNSQFHTLFSQDPSIDLFMVFLAYLISI